MRREEQHSGRRRAFALSRRRVALWLCLGALALSASAQAATRAEEILSTALNRRYETQTLQRLDITVKGPTGEFGGRRLEIASKLFDGQLFVIGRFAEPARMRGTAFLAIESEGASDYFVYLPAFRKVRRVSAYQRSDPWFETDLSFEDVERHYAGDYRVRSLSRGEIAGEPVHVVAAAPRYDSRYQEVRFYIAESDLAILRMEYRRKNRSEASKVIDAPREQMMTRGSAILPRRLVARNLERNSETIVQVEEVVFDPEIQRHFFSAMTLEMRRKMPFAASEESDPPGAP
jgi:hypothetical protein